MRTLRRGGLVSRTCLGAGLVLAMAGGARAVDSAPSADTELVAEGRALFLREWIPGVAVAGGGDGLGPVYNETSCVACHNQGGPGGGGAVDRNVLLATAEPAPAEGEDGKDPMAEIRAIQRKFQAEMAAKRGEKLRPRRAKGAEPDREGLIRLHHGFREASSVVVHRHGPDLRYEVWRVRLIRPNMASGFETMDVIEALPKPLSPIRLFGGLIEIQRSRVVDRKIAAMQARDLATSGELVGVFPIEHGDFLLSFTTRNPPPLFGAGLIDAIPESALVAAARAHPEVGGRVARLGDGRFGRFGWKAQAATLDEFVRTACAVELGLAVPGQEQAADPRVPAPGPIGLDLSERECRALTAFLAALPAPAARSTVRDAEAVAIRAGREAFETVGCAACHVPNLAGVEGIYSDLLLHDMGDELDDAGNYGPEPNRRREELADHFPSGLDAFQGSGPARRSASRREWRTAPLWGVRDSGPYLHDGRATTLEQAIAHHGGQAEATTDRYFSLPWATRTRVLAFLKSLAAPSELAAR